MESNLFLQLRAQSKKYAVGAFNINNLEICKSIANVASRLKSPVIFQTTEGAIKYAGIKNLVSLVKNHIDDNKLSASLHLDHGKKMETIRQCIKSGYSSVMYDGSGEDFETNIKNTKKVVNLAHKKGISVESELGVLAGVEDGVSAKKIIYTDPNQAQEFVQKTGTDTLAVAIGTSHGAYKFSTSSKLKIKVLQEIRKKVNTPLVLHGASGVPTNLKRKLINTNMSLKKAKGVSDKEITEAIKNGITKINIDTDLRLSFTYGIRKYAKENKKDFDPRIIMKESMQEMEKIIEHKILLFGSKNKA